MPPLESKSALTPAKYLDADDSARRYHISKRSWLRLVDAGKAPQPTRFNRLVRWAVVDLEAWEATGCQATRLSRGGKRR